METRKTKAKPAWKIRAEKREKRKSALKELLREANLEAEDDFVDWTWRDLTACADDCDVNYSHLLVTVLELTSIFDT